MIKKTIFLFFFLINYLYAHPHTFIDIYTSVSKIENNQLKVHIKWVFDEMTSGMFLMDFDTNKNNQFEQTEKNTIQKEAFEHLYEFSYYAYIQSNKKDIKQKAQNFDTYMQNNQVVYEFDYILDANLLDKNLSITIQDKEMYIAFVVNKLSFEAKNDIKIVQKDIKGDLTLAYKLDIQK